MLWVQKNMMNDALKTRQTRQNPSTRQRWPINHLMREKASENGFCNMSIRMGCGAHTARQRGQKRMNFASPVGTN